MLLRRERLYSSQLAILRAQLEREGQSGLEGEKPGRKPLKDAKERCIERLEGDKAKLAPGGVRNTERDRHTRRSIGAGSSPWFGLVATAMSSRRS